jgi:hypothetical protein
MFANNTPAPPQSRKRKINIGGIYLIHAKQTKETTSQKRHGQATGSGHPGWPK